MSLRAHVLVVIVTSVTVFFILRMVRRHRLRAKYSVLWVSLGVVLAVLAAAPTLLDEFSDLVGIRTPALGFLLLAITFLLVLSLHFSWELSRLEDRTRRLAEEYALLSEQQQAATSARGTDDPRSGGDGPGDHDQSVRNEGTADPTRGAFDQLQSGATDPEQPGLP
jgi:hypothetical protein